MKNAKTVTVVCEICGKPYKNLVSHIKTHNMSWKEYSDKFEVPEEYIDTIREKLQRGSLKEKDLERLKAKPTVTPKEVEEKIFDIKPKKEGGSLTRFLEELEISEKELRSLVETFKTGKPLPYTQQTKSIIDIAEREAERKSKFSPIRTKDVNEAEILVEKYGFIVETVKQPTGSKPKEWILRKPE